MCEETKQSPRSENGIIKWYEGDVFFLDFIIKDYYTKEPIVVEGKDKVVIEFHDNRKPIKSFGVVSTNSGVFSIYMDKDSTKLFKVGKYHYKIKYHKNDSETIQTIYDCGKVEVEGCCQCH